MGGSCLLSPAIITCLPREIAPIAFSVQTCEASSNITVSNLKESASKNRLTDNGDIIGQGFKVIIKLGIALNKRRIGIILRCLFISRFSMLISSTPLVKRSSEGKLLIKIERIRDLAIANCNLSSSPNSLSSCVWFQRRKLATTGNSGSTLSSQSRKNRR